MLVPREDLPNAISLNTVMVQVAQVGGPALGGIVIALTNVGVGVRLQRDLVPLRHRRAADDARRAARPSAARAHAGDDDVAPRGAGGAALRVPLADDSLDDAARFLRDVLRVGDRAAADLRAGHPARRPARLRLALRRARRRREPRQPRDGARRRSTSSAAGRRSSGRCSSTASSTVVFGLSTMFWLSFAVPGAVGRERRGEHGDPQPRAPARHARRACAAA